MHSTNESAARQPSINQWSPPDEVELRRLEFEPRPSDRPLTHRVIRFPAKFHPPVVERLVNEYSSEGHTLLDPFCGSGTLLVEASIADRNAIGFDVDPLSVFVAHTKSQRLSVRNLELGMESLLSKMQKFARGASEYERLKFEDLSDEEFGREKRGLKIPAIPNLDHWFRRYAIVDLARLHKLIEGADVPSTARNVFLLTFAAIIRAASNADPVPISGLERTKHIIERDEKGRVINPFALFERRMRRTLADFENYSEERSSKSRCRAMLGDATMPLQIGPQTRIDAVITSPPYHGAVDYYRRHQLEMFWLGLTGSQEDRLQLLDRYLGRPNVPQSHRFVLNTNLAMWPQAAETETKIRSISPRRADSFRHYCVGMATAFHRLSEVLQPGAPAVFVVGHSQWNNSQLETSSLFTELAGSKFALDEELWYPVKNRHMSYARHNGANIDREFVLVFRRSPDPH